MPLLEGLEPRRLLSAVVVGSTLEVEGTSGNDVIRISKGDTFKIKIGTVLTSLPTTGVTLIRVKGLAGNDRIFEGAHQVGPAVPDISRPPRRNENPKNKKRGDPIGSPRFLFSYCQSVPLIPRSISSHVAFGKNLRLKAGCKTRVVVAVHKGFHQIAIGAAEFSMSV